MNALVEHRNHVCRMQKSTQFAHEKHAQAHEIAWENEIREMHKMGKLLFFSFSIGRVVRESEWSARRLHFAQCMCIAQSMRMRLSEIFDVSIVGRLVVLAEFNLSRTSSAEKLLD